MVGGGVKKFFSEVIFFFYLDLTPGLSPPLPNPLISLPFLDNLKIVRKKNVTFFISRHD